MKHYKEGRNHIFEFGEMSITRIKLKQSHYDELAQYFAKQQVKNLNIPAVINRRELLIDFIMSVDEVYGMHVRKNAEECVDNYLKSINSL